MAQTPSICVICNPAAARGAAGRRFRRIRQLLGQHADYQSSAGPGHAEQLAREAALAGYAAVVAAGGDGTVHEVANGLLGTEGGDVAMGVIPLGSGNDYAASLGLSNHDEDLCQKLLEGHSRQVDVGRVTNGKGRSRYFVNTLGLGLGAAVVWEIQHIRALQGMALYGLGALRAIWRHFQTLDTRFQLDGKSLDLPTLFMSVALGRREGGGFLVAPEAELDDGLFDYLHASRLSRLQALWYLPGLARGRLPTNVAAIRRGRCEKLTLECTTPLLVHVDGELFAAPGQDVKHLLVTLLPKALRVRAPAR